MMPPITRGVLGSSSPTYKYQWLHQGGRGVDSCSRDREQLGGPNTTAGGARSLREAIKYYILLTWFVLLEVLTYLLMAAVAILMGFGKDGKGVIITDSDTMTLGALATNAMVKQDNPLAFTDRFRLIKVSAIVTGRGFTVGDGPIQVGMASNSLSVAEIAEALSANGPLNRQDALLRERAERPVWRLGHFPSNAGQVTQTESLIGNAQGNGAEGVVEFAPRWTFGVVSGLEGWTWWARNRSGEVLVTGVVITLECKYFGVWTD